MKVLLILAHPDAGSFNHAIAGKVAETLSSYGHEVLFHDLCAEGFDPLLPAREIPRSGDIDPVVERHCRELVEAGGLVFVHPNWWGQPPAILKGWIDRVIRPGVAYEFLEGDGGEGVPRGLLNGKTALVFNTSNTALEREQGVFGDPLELIWKRCIFGLCGVERYSRTTFRIVVASGAEERRFWLEQAAGITRDYFPRC